jgi:ATP-dependent helicase HrpB
LDDLGAIAGGKLTLLGKRMLAFPVHPRYARMLLAAEEHRCIRGIALIAALTQGRNLLRRAEGKEVRQLREDFFGSEDESDLFVLQRAFRFAEKNQFDPRRCARLGIDAAAAREAGNSASNSSRSLVMKVSRLTKPHLRLAWLPAACSQVFPDQVAARLDQGTLRCALVHHRRGMLARESMVSPRASPHRFGNS